MSRVFIDTNVLLYANDPRDPRKQAAARSTVEELARSGRGVVSTQVLQEFASNGLSKLRLSGEHVRAEIERFGVVFYVVPVLPAVTIRATQLIDEASISFWDALIVAAAESAECDVLLTEDLNAGQLYGRVRIENPFISHQA